VRRRNGKREFLARFARDAKHAEGRLQIGPDVLRMCFLTGAGNGVIGYFSMFFRRSYPSDSMKGGRFPESVQVDPGPNRHADVIILWLGLNMLLDNAVLLEIGLDIAPMQHNVYDNDHDEKQGCPFMDLNQEMS
jgi:hypothetical protein